MSLAWSSNVLSLTLESSGTSFPFFFTLKSNGPVPLKENFTLCCSPSSANCGPTWLTRVGEAAKTKRVSENYCNNPKNKYNKNDNKLKSYIKNTITKRIIITFFYKEQRIHVICRCPSLRSKGAYFHSNKNTNGKRYQSGYGSLFPKGEQIFFAPPIKQNLWRQHIQA